eukprot:CFRG8634T1
MNQGFDFVAVGNECSANEGNGLIASGPNCDVQVNHQYDKSFSFELQANSPNTSRQYNSPRAATSRVVTRQFTRHGGVLGVQNALSYSCFSVLIWIHQYHGRYLETTSSHVNLCGQYLRILWGLGFTNHSSVLGRRVSLEWLSSWLEIAYMYGNVISRYKNYSCNTNVPLPVFLAYHARMLDKTPSCLPRPVTPLASGDRKLIPDGVVPLSEVTPSPSHI